MKTTIVNEKKEEKEFEYDFMLSSGIYMATNHVCVINNNQSFGGETPEPTEDSPVAVKFKKVMDDCIATISVKGEGVYQFIINKKANLEQAQKFDANTFSRFKSILEIAYKMACSSSFNEATKNTKMQL